MKNINVDLKWKEYETFLKDGGVVAKSGTPFHPVHYVIKNGLLYNKFKAYITQCGCEYDDSIYLGGCATLDEAKRLCEADFKNKISEFIVT